MGPGISLWTPSCLVQPTNKGFFSPDAVCCLSRLVKKSQTTEWASQHREYSKNPTFQAQVT